MDRFLNEKQFERVNRVKTIIGFDGKECLQLTRYDLKPDTPDIFTNSGRVNKSFYSPSLCLEDFDVPVEVMDKYETVYYEGLGVNDVSLGGRILKGNTDAIMRPLQSSEQKHSEDFRETVKTLTTSLFVGFIVFLLFATLISLL